MQTCATFIKKITNLLIFSAFLRFRGKRAFNFIKTVKHERNQVSMKIMKILHHTR